MKGRNEHRDIAYRTRRDERDQQRGEAGLIGRFAKRYLWPHRASVILCILLASMNSSSIYLQAYYGRIVVDDILVVGNGDSRPASGGISGMPDRAPEAIRESSGTRTATIPQPDRLRQRPPRAGRRLLTMFLVYALTIVVLHLGNLVAQRRQFSLARDITTRLRQDMHEKILSLSSLYHQTHTPGRLMARILSDVNMVQRQMVNLLVTSISQVIMFLVGLGILLVLNRTVTMIVLLSLVPYALLMGRARRVVKRTSREIRQTNASLWSLASQKLDSIRAVIAYARHKLEYLCFHRLSSCLLRDTIHQQRAGAGMNRSAQIISACTSRGIFLYCTYLVVNQQMTLGTMMFIFGAATSLYVPVLQLTQAAIQVSQLLVVLQRLTHVFETPVEVEDSPRAVAFPSPMQAGIRLHRVSFAYQEEAAPVLEDISLNIGVSRWLCILGPSGSGKTSLINLIARMFDPTSGEITVDGIPLANIRLASLRRSMAMVPQEPQIISGTIRDNIIYGQRDASPSQIMDAAKAADCHDFIMELPVRYETIVGDRGITLSGGQRQRISIARALLSKPEVLLLDDCTSALDANTEQRLQTTLARIMLDKTAIVVSQRVSMAMRCHKIAVLEQGRIIEIGSHEKLMARGGYYANLHSQQTLSSQ